jgi:tol-pal system protein YbgF
MRNSAFPIFSFRTFTAVLLLAGCVAAVAPAQAQSARDLEERIRRLEQQVMRGGGGGVPGVPMDGTADLQARVIKLEQLVSDLTGQLEEARFKNGQLTTQIEQLSNDMNYRVAAMEQAVGGGQGVAPGQALPTTPPPQQPRANTQRPQQRQLTGDQIPDTYDPNSPLSRPLSKQPDPTAPPVRTQQPVDPGVPAPMTDGSVRASTPGDNTFGSLRTDAQGRPLAADPNAPQAPAPQQRAELTPPSQPVPQRAPNPGPVAGSNLGANSGPATAKLPEGTPKAQYDYAFDYLKRQDYTNAEATFREFLKKYPKDPLAGNAQYWLGETHYVRGDYQKAAVEFMNGYQNYPKSNKAPDNLLKLGMAMANIGQTQGACTALGRLNKEYPDAGDQIRRSVQQERSKLKCQ